MLEFAETLQHSELSIALQSRTWLTPTLQAVHILMIGVVFGSMLLIALRVLGRMRADEPFADVWARFAPWMWAGLAVMLVTGIVLIINEPVREFTSKSFWTKLVLIAVGTASLLSLRHSVAPAAPSSGLGGAFSSGQRAVAMGTVAIWLLIIFFGRAIAYDTEIWGLFGLGA